jgi:hypothetical protein
MVKGGYDKTYEPYKILIENEKIIDTLLQPGEIESLGVKYSCFNSR